MEWGHHLLPTFTEIISCACIYCIVIIVLLGAGNWEVKDIVVLPFDLQQWYCSDELFYHLDNLLNIL